MYTGAHTRSAIRYAGGKGVRNMAAWIISHMPPHEVYVEPFGGAANVLIRKAPAKFEVYNDLYDDVVRFFRVLRNQPDELIHLLQLTPYAVAEFKAAWEPSLNDLEAARRFYVRSWQSFGGEGGRSFSGGWRRVLDARNGHTTISRWNNFHHLQIVAKRLMNTQIESMDAIECLRRYDAPGTLFYIDPPYLPKTRHPSNRYYKHELNLDDHLLLIDTINGLGGMVVLSGYDSDFYRDHLSGWIQKDRQAVSTNGINRTESIWLSPNIEVSEQLSLF